MHDKLPVTITLTEEGTQLTVCQRSNMIQSVRLYDPGKTHEIFTA